MSIALWFYAIRARFNIPGASSTVFHSTAVFVAISTSFGFSVGIRMPLVASLAVKRSTAVSQSLIECFNGTSHGVNGKCDIREGFIAKLLPGSFKLRLFNLY